MTTRQLFFIIFILSSTVIMASEALKHSEPHFEIYAGAVLAESESGHAKEDESGFEIGLGVSRGCEKVENLYWTAEVDFESLESGDIKSYTAAVIPKYAINHHVWLGAGINYVISDHEGHDFKGFGYQLHADFHLTDHIGAYLKFKSDTLEDDHDNEVDTTAFSLGMAYLF